jgi:hypothetical protein
MDERGLIGWELFIDYILSSYIGQETDWKEAAVDEMNKWRI